MHKLLIFYLAFVAFNVEALIYKYEYEGNTLNLVKGNGEYGDTVTGYSGSMLIDENLLPGGSLANTSVSFLARSTWGWGSGNEQELLEEGYAIETQIGVLLKSSHVDGLVAFDIHPIPGEVEASINFTTDDNRNIISWFTSYTDGYNPDGNTGSNGDWEVYEWGDEYYAPPGIWSAPAVVPIPGTLWLLSTAGLAIIFGIRQRFRLKSHSLNCKHQLQKAFYPMKKRCFA